MKIEIEVADIRREEVIESMAAQLLTEWHDENDDETGPTRYRRETNLGRDLKAFLEKKIAGLAETLVREQFDAVIHERIAKTVDDVLAAGWVRTDEYGNAIGSDRLDLKARISKLISDKQRDGYGGPQYTLSEKLIKEAVEKTLTRELNHEITAARNSLKAQLDAIVSGKFAETLKAAMGVK